MSTPNVYFYLPPNDDVYFDAPLVLAEGLRELGIPFSANRNWWRLSPERNETLFQDQGLRHDEADIVVIHDDWFYYFPQSTLQLTERAAPPGLFRDRRSYRLVYLDTWVGARSNSWHPEFRHCDLILRTQFNRRCQYPGNMRPWVLGFTSRILKATGQSRNFGARTPVIAENFGYTHHFPHGLRERYAKEIAPVLHPVFPADRTISQPQPKLMSPYDRLMWEQSVDKHNPDYFTKLGAVPLVAAFCGSLCPAFPPDATVHYRGQKRYQFFSRLTRALAAGSGLPERVIQWDSWRFWESLCAGAIPLHVDLEKYGAALPVAPVNWQHYLGVDLDEIPSFIARLRDCSSELAGIAHAGRVWALQHYSPKQMALRFLSLTGFPVSVP